MWYVYPPHTLGTKGKGVLSLGLVVPVLTFGEEKNGNMFVTKRGKRGVIYFKEY